MRNLISLICALAMITALPAAEIAVSGSWMETIDAGDLISGAGSDVRSTHESTAGATTITISNTAGAGWRIYARTMDGSWNGQLTLFVRRTSDGSGAGTVSGGESYVQLSSIDTEIFSGTGDRSSIALQLRLSGMSKDISPSTYNSSIIFTVDP